MKYVFLIVISLILLLLVYGYLRVKYIERNIVYGLKVKNIDIDEIELLNAIRIGEIKFNSTFTLTIINNSNISVNIRKLRIIILTESGNLSIISQEIKKVSITSRKETSFDIPSKIIIKSSAIREALSLIRGESLKINYKVFGRIFIFPLYHEGTIVL